jgi:thymidylate kinase
MGIRNYLIEGVSGTGKTTVAKELQRLGYHVLHGDRELKYRGDPKTGAPLDEPAHANALEKTAWEHEHLLWHVDKVKSVIADHSVPVSFFCGSCQNLYQFVDLLDGIFILEVEDINILLRRIDERVARDPTDFGAKPEEREFIAYMYQTKKGLPQKGIHIDATAPLTNVVDNILLKCCFKP